MVGVRLIIILIVINMSFLSVQKQNAPVFKLQTEIIFFLLNDLWPPYPYLSLTGPPTRCRIEIPLHIRVKCAGID